MGAFEDLVVWALAAAGVLIAIGAALMYAPAKTSILIDTSGSAARAEMQTLWGMGPRWTGRLIPAESAGAPLAVFNDPARIGHALMTPGIADAAYHAVRELYDLKPRVVRVEVRVNLADTAQNRVVQTAVEAALASAPAALRERVRVEKCEAPGAEIVAAFELYASPAQINSIWTSFKQSRSIREFIKRLKRKPKPQKRAPKEVRAT
jgi:hypothetical protein